MSRFHLDNDTQSAEDDGWQTSSLIEEGVDSEKIADLIRDVLGGKLENIHSILLVKNGRLILDGYFDGYNRDTKHYLASVTKSIASVLIGVAMDQGFIDGIAQGGLDKTVLDLFPGYEMVIKSDPAKQDLLFKHVLSMSAGLEWDEHTHPYDDPQNDWYKASHSEDSVGFVLQKSVNATPGTEFLYNGGLSILLSHLIEKNTGMHAAGFAERYLFKPLGIEDYFWDHIFDGLTDTDGGLHMRPRDMAKIGYLLLNGGKWKGSQIVSPAWINESTKAHIATGAGPEYAYQWWCGRLSVNGQNIETFFASGYGGQKIFVFPTLDLVAVFTHKVFDNPLGDIRNQAMLARYIIPAVLPPGPPREPIDLDSKDLDKYAGQYESEQDKDILTIFRERNRLYVHGQDVDRVELFPETEMRFFGTAIDILDFHINFVGNEHGEVEHLVLDVGFRSVRYNRISG